MSLSLMPPSLAAPTTPVMTAPIQKIAHEKTRAFEGLIQKKGYRDLRNIEVRLRDGWVILRGEAPSYYMKQVAQEAVRPLAIGLQIRNEITVI